MVVNSVPHPPDTHLYLWYIFKVLKVSRSQVQTHTGLHHKLGLFWWWFTLRGRWTRLRLLGVQHHRYYSGSFTPEWPSSVSRSLSQCITTVASANVSTNAEVWRWNKKNRTATGRSSRRARPGRQVAQWSSYRRRLVVWSLMVTVHRKSEN